MQNEHHEGSDGVSDIARAGSMLRAAIPPLEFREGFSDRIMQQLAASGVQQSPDVLRFDAIERGFRMLAAAAAVAIVALSAHNTVITRVADTSFIDAAIGLQPVSAESILSYPSEALQ